MAKGGGSGRAPHFELPETGGKNYPPGGYPGRKVILAFYPGDAPTLCTKQFCDYRDQGDRLDALGAEVLGISPQSVDSHEHWVKEQELNVPLLADVDLAVAKRYGVTGWIGPLARFTELKDAPGGRYVQRAIFLLDRDGVVRPKTVSRTGSSYESVEDLERAVAAIG